MMNYLLEAVSEFFYLVMINNNMFHFDLIIPMKLIFNVYEQDYVFIFNIILLLYTYICIQFNDDF